jgi:ribose-phosphate diphosphokinase
MFKIKYCLSGKEHTTKYSLDTFPAGEMKLDLEKQNGQIDGYYVEWYYENDAEFTELFFIVSHIRNKKPHVPITLCVPYFPHARMDRTKEEQQVFTLKYAADFINKMNFNRVIIHDPHSDVTPALLNNCEHFSILDNLVKHVICSTEQLYNNKNYNVLVFPDNTAMKRYEHLLYFTDGRYVVCHKKRDFNTGKITEMKIETDLDVSKSHHFIMVDDICSRGGTFLLAKEKISEKFTNNNTFTLCVAHCEPTIFHGGIDFNVFTSDSLYPQLYKKAIFRKQNLTLEYVKCEADLKNEAKLFIFNEGKTK